MVGRKQQNGEMQCVVSCLKLPGLEDGRHDGSFFKGLKGFILDSRRDHGNYRMINLTSRPGKTKENAILNLILRLMVYLAAMNLFCFKVQVIKKYLPCKISCQQPCGQRAPADTPIGTHCLDFQKAVNKVHKDQ